MITTLMWEYIRQLVLRKSIKLNWVRAAEKLGNASNYDVSDVNTMHCDMVVGMFILNLILE